MTAEVPVTTGSPTIDEFLDGGIDRGAITQVYGPPAAGKSTLAMAAAVALAGDGGEAVYIDTEGLSVGRLEQLVEELYPATERAAVLDRIRLSRAESLEEQGAKVRDAAAIGGRLELIILDSVTARYRLERAANGDDGDALDRLANQLILLLSTARRYDLAVLVTNQVFTDPDTDTIHPLGGETLAHWSETILRLDRFRGPRRQLAIEKYRGEPADAAIFLELADRGFIGLDSPG